MTNPLLTIEDILTAANDIYETLDDDKKDAMRALIDVYYSKVQNISAQKVVFSESEAICPHCLGVRLLKREIEISMDVSSLNKDYKCPICKSWYASSEVHSSDSISPDVDPVQSWKYGCTPEALAALVPVNGWITVVPHNYKGDEKPVFITGEEYGILPDGRVGQMLTDGSFKVFEGINVPDLFGYTIYVFSR